MRKVVSLLLIPLAFSLSCARNSLSERDSRREQLRNSADIKRKELEQVAGDYAGRLIQDDGTIQNASIHLEVKDVPTAVEGQVDPVMTPTLAGFLRFNLSQDASEYVGFSLEKAEYDPSRAALDLVANNEIYKKLILGLKLTGNTLSGKWTAPDVSGAGSATFTKNADAASLAVSLRGEYLGVLKRDALGMYQFANLTLNTTFTPPNGLKVSGILKVIFGPWDSTEYLTYRFDEVFYNPINGQLVMKGEGLDASFIGVVNQGKLQGDWYSSYTGRLGKAAFDKKPESPPLPSSGALFDTLKGTYKGKITNTNPQSNLPERAMVSFVTSQDLSAASGLKVTGTLRLYLGDFESQEYIELPFTDIQYNFYTQQIVAKTGGATLMTFKGEVRTDKQVVGKLFSDSLGEMATLKVEKE